MLPANLFTWSNGDVSTSLKLKVQITNGSELINIPIFCLIKRERKRRASLKFWRRLDHLQGLVYRRNA